MTPKLPANGRATSSLAGKLYRLPADRVNDLVFITLVSGDRLMRLAQQRRQLRLWRFFQWELAGIHRARRRVSGPGRRAWLVLLGDPPSLDEDDSDPHCCV